MPRLFKRSEARSLGFIDARTGPLSRAAEAFVAIAKEMLST
jgi:hypothetical protein